MRRILILLLIFMLSLCGCTAVGETNDVWMYACSVGKADAILVGVGDAVCLIDAGHAYSRGKILAAMEKMGVDSLDAVFVTHTDDDHVDGLEWLAESDIKIGAWYASAMYIGVKKEEKHPAVKAAKKDGQKVNWLKAGDSVPLGDAVLDVLAPSVLNEDKDDNNSLVMMLRSAQGNILLAGDMEVEEESVLLSTGANVECDVLKVGNHADDDTCSEAFIRAASPKVAVISTSTAEKPETPDPRAVALLESVGAEVVVTQEALGGILVRLNGGNASVEKIDLLVPFEGVVIGSVSADEDIIELVSFAAHSRTDLSGWYLFSDKGNEMFIFPEGTFIDAGGSLIIGTKSTEGKYDLLWNEKNVIHNSKTDTIRLYDRYGLPSSSRTNGY